MDINNETRNYAFTIMDEKELKTFDPNQPTFYDIKYQPWFIPVDEWVPQEEDKIFKTVKGILNLPVSSFYNTENKALDTFVLSTKRCYGIGAMLDHLPHYMNYFLKYYDYDKELLGIMYHIKFMIDYHKEYNEEFFKRDLYNMILSPSIVNKTYRMNEDNYQLELDKKNYRNDKNPALQYRDNHAKLLMHISLLMNMMIPLLTHFMYVNKILSTNDFLLVYIDMILEYMRIITGVDIYSKLYETNISNVTRDSKDNSLLWEMQDIRGDNPTTHSLSSVSNILLNIVPKYVYSLNIIFLNYTSIKKSTGFKVTDIAYEFNFVSLSTSKRDMDNNSEFDKFESYLIRQSESLYLLNKCAAEAAMKQIECLYGPFNDDEIKFYEKRLKGDDGEIINNFQRKLIFYLFNKYFGDPSIMYGINQTDYIKLLIATRNRLNETSMILLPYIITGKILRIKARKSINKKELLRVETSEYHDEVLNKYGNHEKIKNEIMSIIATILASDFAIIDYHDPTLDGNKIVVEVSDIIYEEVRMFITMI